MVPPPPPLFSMSSGWPSVSLIRWPTSRATMSVVPPGGNGTRTRTGLAGNAWAAANAGASSPRQKSRNFMGLPLLGLDAGRLDQLAILLQLARDHRLELPHGHRQRVAAELADLLRDLGRVHQRGDVL